MKQKWAFSTFHTAERRQHRPPLRGGQCAKAQSEWRQVSARRRQAHWRQAQWWHERLRGRRGTSHQYGTMAAMLLACGKQRQKQPAGLRVETGEVHRMESENIESCRLQFTVAFSV